MNLGNPEKKINPEGSILLEKGKKRPSQRLQVFRCGRLKGWLPVPLTESRRLEEGNKFWEWDGTEQWHVIKNLIGLCSWEGNSKSLVSPK